MRSPRISTVIATFVISFVPMGLVLNLLTPPDDESSRYGNFASSQRKASETEINFPT